MQSISHEIDSIDYPCKVPRVVGARNCHRPITNRHNVQDIEVFMRAVRGLVEDLTEGEQTPFHDSNLREGFRFYHEL